MENIQKEKLTPEELEAQEAKSEEDVRENIIDEFGFDEVDDADKIDKLVEKEMDNSRKLSSAIGQKIKHRTEAEELREKLGTPNESKDEVVEIDQESLDKMLDDKLNDRLEKKDMDALDYPDELKNEIQKVAKVQNISIKQAQQDPYIAFKIEAYEKEQTVEEATISRTNKSKGSKDYSMDTPPVVDMNTSEGRETWEDYKQAMKEKGN